MTNVINGLFPFEAIFTIIIITTIDFGAAIIGSGVVARFFKGGSSCITSIAAAASFVDSFLRFEPLIDIISARQKEIIIQAIPEGKSLCKNMRF